MAQYLLAAFVLLTQESGWCQESAVTPSTLIAASWYVPWEKLSDWGEPLVAEFGLLLWILLIFSLLRLGIHTVLTGQDKRTKHKRGKHEEQRIQLYFTSNIQHRDCFPWKF